MPTFNEIYKTRLQPGITVELTHPEVIEELRKYAQDTRNVQSGKALTVSEAAEEVLYCRLVAKV